MYPNPSGLKSGLTFIFKAYRGKIGIQDLGSHANELHGDGDFLAAAKGVGHLSFSEVGVDHFFAHSPAAGCAHALLGLGISSIHARESLKPLLPAQSSPTTAGDIALHQRLGQFS